MKKLRNLGKWFKVSGGVKYSSLVREKWLFEAMNIRLQILQEFEI